MNTNRSILSACLRLLTVLALVSVAVFAASAPAAAAPPPVIYVYWKATGANNGTSWKDAYTDLQSGLAGAAGGGQIWVAAGRYKPSVPAARSAPAPSRCAIMLPSWAVLSARRRKPASASRKSISPS